MTWEKQLGEGPRQTPGQRSDRFVRSDCDALGFRSEAPVGSMGKPSLRVVIPCFNHGRTVREAALSAFGLEDANVEVVVVDDGSDDGTSPARCDECRAFGATVIHQANGGLSAARNRGAVGAQTEYLAFLDADDLLLPHFATDLAAAIEAEIKAGRDDVSHAYGQEQVTGIYELVWKVPPWDPVRELITNLHPVTALVRRAVFERAGGFDESMRQGHEDWEFWIRCVGLGLRGVRVEKPVFVWRRFHTESLLYEALDSYEGNVAHILARHADLYREHALPIIERALEMLHHADATWLDEDYAPIHVRNRRAWVAQLEAERAGPADAIARVRESYEAKPIVRLSHGVHDLVESLPKPIARLTRRILGSLLAAMARRFSRGPDER